MIKKGPLFLKLHINKKEHLSHRPHKENCGGFFCVLHLYFKREGNLLLIRKYLKSAFQNKFAK